MGKKVPMTKIHIHGAAHRLMTTVDCNTKKNKWIMNTHLESKKKEIKEEERERIQGESISTVHISLALHTLSSHHLSITPSSKLLKSSGNARYNIVLYHSCVRFFFLLFFVAHYFTGGSTSTLSNDIDAVQCLGRAQHTAAKWCEQEYFEMRTWCVIHR